MFWGEDKVRRRLTWDVLRADVGRASRAFAAAGVGAGDRVAGILPNMPESITSMLGAATIGAVWSSCSPDFGVQGVLDRFGQIEPKVLVACDGYYYNGKAIDISDKLAQIAAQLPSVREVIVVPYLGQEKTVVQGLNAALVHAGRRANDLGRCRALAAACPTRGSNACRSRIRSTCSIRRARPACRNASCIRPAAHCSSILCEQRLHTDIKPGDRLFYFTTLGWMMWNWLASGLASGATLLLYDGSPFHPDGNILWDYAQAERCTHFGTSAKYIDALKKAGLAPAKTHDLDLAAHAAVDRLAAGAGELRLRLRGDQAGPASGLHLRRHRHLRLLRAGRPDEARVARRDPGPGAGARRGRGGRGRQAARTRQGRARLHQALPVDAGRVLERRRRARSTAPPTSRALPTSGITATSPNGPSTAA